MSKSGQGRPGVFGRPSLRATMAMIAAGALVATAVLGIFLYSAGQQRNGRSRAVAQDTLEVSLLQDARAAAVAESTSFVRYSILGREQSLGIARESSQQVDAALSQARAQAIEVEPKDIKAIEAAQEAHARLAASYDQVIGLIQDGSVEEGIALGVALNLDSRSVNFLDDLAGMVTDERAEREVAQLSYQAAEARSDQTVFTIVAVWTSFIVAGLILTFRWIVRPVEHIGRVAKGVASGDRYKRAPEDGPAEIAALGASINQMAGALLEHSRRLERSLAAEHERARRDPVTGALNHGAIVAEIKERIAIAAGSFAVIMADVDGLKETNDVYGHPMGDRALVAVAAALSTKRAVVGRYGGDEFVALLRDASLLEAQDYIDAVRSALSESTLSAEGDAQVAVVASLGFAMYPGDAATVDDLIRISDRTMYKTKRGRPPYAQRRRSPPTAA